MDLVTPYAIFFLLSSATVSGVTTVAVVPRLHEQINENQTKLPGLGLQQLRFHLLVEPVPCHTINYFISEFVDISISTAVSPFLSPHSLVITLGVLCCVA